MTPEGDPLAELRAIARRARRKLDDDSIQFLAFLHAHGALEDSDWQRVKLGILEALAWLRYRARRRMQGIEEGPLDADWIRLVRIYKLTGFRLPGWATQWLRQGHPHTDVRFWRRVGRLARAYGLPRVARRSARKSRGGR